MNKLIVYHDITEKNEIERERFKALDPDQALIHALDMMDFMAAFAERKKEVDDGIPWIRLKIKRQPSSK
jgi:hypothetical protein